MRKVFGLICAMMIAGANFTTDAREVESFDYQISQARLLDATPDVRVTTLTAEVKVVGKRLRKTVKLNLDQLNSMTVRDNDNATVQNLRNYAVFKLCDKFDFDILVAATFDVHITEKGATIRVVGYPANFVNWGGVANPTEPLKARVGEDEVIE